MLKMQSLSSMIILYEKTEIWICCIVMRIFERGIIQRRILRGETFLFVADLNVLERSWRKKKKRKRPCANTRHLFVGLECKGRVANWTLNKGKNSYFEMKSWQFSEFHNREEITGLRGVAKRIRKIANECKKREQEFTSRFELQSWKSQCKYTILRSRILSFFYTSFSPSCI